VVKLLLAIGFLIYLIISTLKDAGNPLELKSVYYKILLSHIQFITIIISFKFHWPEKLVELVSGPGHLANIPHLFLSYDCLFDSFRKNEVIENKLHDYANVLYLNIALAACLPVFIIIISFVVILPLSICSRWNMPKALSTAISAIVISLFFIHSYSIQIYTSIFNCMNIDGEYRVVEDLDIKCSSSEY